MLSVALSLETAFQLRLPFNSAVDYGLLFCGTVMYYTYAYAQPLQSFSPGNPRSAWYVKHHTLVQYTQWVLLVICIVLGGYMFLKDYQHIWNMSAGYWLVIIVMLLS